VGRSANSQTVVELLELFFRYYADFNWGATAVSPKHSQPGCVVPNAAGPAMWTVLDPFDQHHNLAAKCSQSFKTALVHNMRLSTQQLASGDVGSFETNIQTVPSETLLKFRITSDVTQDDVVAFFRSYQLEKIFLPVAQRGNCFVQFVTKEQRRAAMSNNERHLGPVFLVLLPTTHRAMKEEHDLLKEVVVAAAETGRLPSIRGPAEAVALRNTLANASGGGYLRTRGRNKIPLVVIPCRHGSNKIPGFQK